MEVLLGLGILTAFVAVILGGMYFIGARPDLVIAFTMIAGLVALIWDIAT